MSDDFDFSGTVDQFLGSCRTAGLATIDADGNPHAANIQYAIDKDWNIIFVSSPDTAHARHIALNPRVALTIYGHVANWREIHGVQLHGHCTQADDDATRRHAWNVYKLTFPFVLHNETMRARIEKEAFYIIKPAWIRWIDNRQGFGFKVEKTLMA